jgi:N-sulfoglucosamine sulfohydrolase
MAKYIKLGGLALMSTLALSSTKAQPKQVSTRPNLLLFIADDWSSPHAGILGDKTVQTPSFDYVARNGVLFSNAFTAAPTCTASRAAILTGKYSHAAGPAGDLWGLFPKNLPTYTSILNEAGYSVGYTKKGWGPGQFEEGGWADNPAGHYSDNFKKFVQESQSEHKPFCFWYGSKYPHRPYEKGKGEENGIDPRKVIVPEFLPNTEIGRIDMADYYYCVERLDYQLEEVIKILKEAGEFDNTLIIVTSDNGMPFPRAKASTYDSGTKMPFAVMWANKIKPGQTDDQLISTTDIAPTFLEAAEIIIPSDMQGKSLLPVMLRNETLDRQYVFSERERHAYKARPNHGSYPIRSLRSGDYLLIHNINPDRWPGGDPINPYNNQRGYGDVDGSPSKTYVIDNKDDKYIKPFFERSFNKRPEYELYDVTKDPYQINNLAKNSKHSEILKDLKVKLAKWMKDSKDPRANGETENWDNYPYFGKGGIGTTVNMKLDEE